MGRFHGFRGVGGQLVAAGAMTWILAGSPVEGVTAKGEQMSYAEAKAFLAGYTQVLELGCEGGYIFSPAHDVEGDVPLENMLAAIDVVQNQPGYLDGSSSTGVCFA